MDAAALRTASLLGASSGLRTFSGPAALALAGRLGRGQTRVAVIAAGAGELAFDKLPSAPARTHVSGLGARLATGSLAGHRVAGPAGAALGAAAAMGSAFGGLQARTVLVERLPVPDPVVGAAEDAVVLCLVALATGERTGRVAAGVASTAVGTAAMTAAQAAAGSNSDAPGRVGRRLVEGVLGRRVRRRERGPLNHAMHWLYGTSWGVALGALTAGEDEPPLVVPTGLALGLGVWAASLVELPLLGVAPPVWRQGPRQVAADVGFHLVYGFAAAAALRVLRR
jgi:uncharacterized membrane protein